MAESKTRGPSPWVRPLARREARLQNEGWGAVMNSPCNAERMIGLPAADFVPRLLPRGGGRQRCPLCGKRRFCPLWPFARGRGGCSHDALDVSLGAPCSNPLCQTSNGVAGFEMRLRALALFRILRNCAHTRPVLDSS